MLKLSALAIHSIWNRFGERFPFARSLIVLRPIPQKAKDEPYIPSDEDIKKILKAAEGTKYEIPLKLACYGMRRGEILALTPEDIDGTTVHINNALILNENKEWVVKSLGITHFSLHKFRHYFCSKLIAENIDIKTIQKLGGWETDTVPRQVYSHCMKDKEEQAKKDAADLIAKALFF